MGGFVINTQLAQWMKKNSELIPCPMAKRIGSLKAFGKQFRHNEKDTPCPVACPASLFRAAGIVLESSSSR
jgi:hypothetical protein